MNQRQQKKLQRYVELVKPLLGLRDWSISVEVEAPANDNWIAACSDIAGRRVAFVRFGDVFFEDWYTNEERTGTILHELLHCVHAPERHVVTSGALGELLDAPVFETLSTAYVQAHEYSVDTLAAALRPLFPLFEL